MRIVVQRVSSARIEVGGRTVAEIARGLVVLLGVEVGDGAAQALEAARRVGGLRIFEDGAGRMNLGLADVHGAVLAVSQFTLAADLSRGRRPGFEKAMQPDLAEPLYDHFCAALELAGFPVARGIFGAAMRVSLVNEGPATFVIDIPARKSAATRRGL